MSKHGGIQNIVRVLKFYLYLVFFMTECPSQLMCTSTESQERLAQQPSVMAPHLNHGFIFILINC